MQLYKAQQIVRNFGAQYCLDELHLILEKMRKAEQLKELFQQEVRAMNVVVAHVKQSNCSN